MWERRLPSGRESEGAELHVRSLLGQHHCAAGFSPRNKEGENGAAGGDCRQRPSDSSAKCRMALWKESHDCLSRCTETHMEAMAASQRLPCQTDQEALGLNLFSHGVQLANSASEGSVCLSLAAFPNVWDTSALPSIHLLRHHLGAENGTLPSKG